MTRKISLIAASITATASFFVNSDSFAEPNNHCKVELRRADAVDFPSRHAWNLFVKLNHPAMNETISRGTPDCSKPIGTPGTTSVWETWRNAETGSEVYQDDGSEPPDWQDISLPDEAPGSVPTDEGITASDLAGLPASLRRMQLSFHDFGSSVVRPQFSPGDGVFNNRGGFGETRMNRSTYEFIKQNCLWSRDGQQRYAEAISEGKKPPISFPSDSMEVKAAWLDFEKEGIPEAKWSSYYTAEYDDKKYGLTSFHIITKDIPNWFWATFHHIDAPENEFETEDKFGRPKDLDGTVWENYVLGGTQIDFVTPTGKPTILSDHYVEFGFQRSSCITCHATATISSDGSAGPIQEMALCILSPDILGADACKAFVGEDLFVAGSNKLIMEHGTPLARWYEVDAKQVHFQTDFLWSLPFRARGETSPPPDRCKW